MKVFKRGYLNEAWFDFSKKVKDRDNNICTKCHRNNEDILLNVYHLIPKPYLKAWEYPLSDCITLCKGCYARDKGLIEPNTGWQLMYILDLGSLDGLCERDKCNTPIRYEHYTYHPKWGMKIVGSTCIEHLTQDDKNLSANVLGVFKNIRHFINNSSWYNGKTKNGKEFLYTTYNHNQIRIYGNKGTYYFQVCIKYKGIKWFDFKPFIKVNDTKTIEQVKELSFIVLKGFLTNSEEEKILLRNIYSKTR